MRTNNILHFIVILIGFSIFASTVSAQEVERLLQWEMTTQSRFYYPGESVSLRIQITNPSDRDAELWFGSDGIGAFRFLIKDSKGNILQQSKNIERDGIQRHGFLEIPAHQSQVKHIVLNQWCSTLLPSAQYVIVCVVSPYYVPFEPASEISEPTKAQRLPEIALDCHLEVVDMEVDSFIQNLQELMSGAVKPVRTLNESNERILAQEMIAFTESELAVPYQLKILPVAQSTWTRRDIIHSLTLHASPQAAKGLVEFYENPKLRKVDINNDVIEAVYKMRESNDAEILSLTEDFVTKHKRPPIPTDRKLNGNGNTGDSPIKVTEEQIKR